MTLWTTPRIRLRILAVTAFTLMIAAPTTARSQQAVTGKANWELAARFAPAKMRDLVYSTSVNPQWLRHSDRFYYTYETPDGRQFNIVDPARKSRAPLFDRDRMASQLTLITKDPYDAEHLPIRSVTFAENDRLIRFDVTSTQDAPPDTSSESEVGEQQRGNRQRGGRTGGRQQSKKKVFHFEYDLTSGQLREQADWEERKPHPNWASISPDHMWVVFSRDHDLWMMDAENYAKAREAEDDSTIVEIQLTTDGEEDYSFGGGRGASGEGENADRRQRAGVTWSRDSKKFAIERDDQRKVKDLWVIHSLAEPRPTLETYKYDMPGEKDVTQAEIYVFDVASRERVQIQEDRFKDQTVQILSARRRTEDTDESGEWPTPSFWLAPGSDELWFERTSRDLHRIDVCAANTTTGEVRNVIEERLNTYVDTQRLEYLTSTNELIWWSERDGWGHYYLYGTDGTLKRQITSGPFTTLGIDEVDEKNRVIYFTAAGREAGEDPYYEHGYRIGLDGNGMRLLTPGASMHSPRMNEKATYFVDTYSRVDSAPHSALYNAAGEKLLDLEDADLKRLQEFGYTFPEPFQVKAADGVTDLYGVMYKPFDFDPEKKYPIIAYVYPGPQTESVTKAFSTSSNIGLAQFGFIVIEVGNRGGHPNRSKWYHNYGYGNLRDYGLADKKAAIEQLAARDKFIDIDRVGIYGHSGGGFMSTAAMLVYPDFFKVAVSSSGNHENNIYNKWWSEKHHGVKEVTDAEGNVTFEYDIDKNSEIAGNLKGHLLITTGDMDNNVHPSNTFRLANALIRANKRFDIFVFPGQRHGYGDMNEYFHWLRAEYFVKYLIGDDRTAADIKELTNLSEQGGGGR